MSGQREEMAGRLILGRYRIVRRLARGGMGVVYLARAEGAAGFVKPVVVKRIIPDLTEDEKMARMFVREARILSHLQHPGIVGVLDFGEEGDAYIMVLEYVHGYHLGRWARYKRETAGRFPADLAIQVIIEVLQALHYAHSRMRDGKSLGIVHRDISPSNIFIDVEGHVKLLDFGIARMTGDSAEYKTQEVTLKGKLAYLGPELLHGSPPTAQSDIYATGVVLHELLVGRNEFRGREMSDTVNRVLNTTPTLVTQVRDDAPPGIDAIVQKALAKSFGERYKTAAEFAQALRECRTVPEDEASTRLAEEVQHDFHGEMPERLGLEPLRAIDEAWRSPPPELLTEADTEPIPIEDTEFDPAPRTSQPPTAVLRPGARQEETSVDRAPARSAWPRTLRLLGAAAILLLTAGAAAAVALHLQRQPDPKDPPRVVVVNSSQTPPAEPADPATEVDARASGDRPSATAERAAEQVEVDAGTTSVDAGQAEHGEHAEGQARRRDRAAPRRAAPRTGARSLTRAFGAKGPAVRRCFSQHSAEVEGAPTLSVRFSIDAQGRVQRAEILPATVGSTSLGQCLLAVARGVRFPGQGRPMNFRIPLNVR